MKIRNLILAGVMAAGLIATQFTGTGPAHAIGGSTGGVWKTTDGGPNYAPATVELAAQDQDPSLLLPAVQKVRCTSRYC